MTTTLVDSNIWRYMVDASAVTEVARASRRLRIELAVAPAVVYEALRSEDAALRRALIGALTEPHWKRLMPEAYSESQELLAQLGRCRPHWLRSQPDLHWFRRVRFDWMRGSGGFWDRARSDPDGERRRLAKLEGGLLGHARVVAGLRREDAKQMPAQMPSLRLTELWGKTSEPGQDSEGAVQLWRIDALMYYREALLQADGPVMDWVGGQVDLGAIFADPGDFRRFWLHDAAVEDARRCWLRTAFEHLQQFHRVTDGTPVDAQLAAYLPDADFVVSADKNFVRFADRCHDEAPFRIAKPVLLPAGRDAVPALLDHLAVAARTKTGKASGGASN